jgi:hypothetical protein
LRAASDRGGAIKVCPGTYVEQVRIEKNNLTLYSSVPLQAVIKSPPLMTQPNSVVLVRNERNDAMRTCFASGSR